MAIDLADIDTWDPGRIRDAFQAVFARADAASEVHMGLSGLPAFLTWDGEAKEAAQAALNKTAKELLLHAQEANVVAARAQKAIDLIADVKAKLHAADEDARKWGFTINRTTGQITPQDPSTVGQLDSNLHLVDLANRVQKILVEANAADTELAGAINIADGAEPIAVDKGPLRQQAIDESINRALHEAQLPPGVDPRLVRGVLNGAATQFPPPRVGELGIPGYPDATLTSTQARNVYTYGEQQMKALNDQMVKEGVSPEVRAKTLFATRNALRSWARDLMVDRAAAEALNANEKNFTWEQITEKYSNQGIKGDDLWDKIIDSSTRSRPSVNAGLGVDPEAPELPPIPGAAGPAGPRVPIPEVPVPEVPAPAPPVIEAPPPVVPPIAEIPEVPPIIPIIEP